MSISSTAHRIADHGLSRISGSFVIARNTAFTFKGKPVDESYFGGIRKDRRGPRRTGQGSGVRHPQARR
jgi:hypothetical protein